MSRSYECEETAFCRTREHTARRKEHQCAECEGAIRLGERYTYMVYKCVSDYEVSAVYLHHQCHEDWKAISSILEMEGDNPFHVYICWHFGDLVEYVELAYRDELIDGAHELAKRYLAGQQWFHDEEDERHAEYMTDEEYAEYLKNQRLRELERIHAICEEEGQKRLPL